jgi:hypothetical protein
MDVGKSIGYVFEDKKWTNKLLIGMLVSIVPIVNFALFGWIIDIMKNVSQRQAEPMPEWNNFGDKFVKGLILFVVGLIYSLPAMLIVWVAMIPMVPPLMNAAFRDVGQRQLTEMFFSTFALSLCAIAIYGLFISFLMPAILLNFARKGTVVSCFEFGEIWRIMSKNLGDYIVAWLIIIVVGIGVSFVIFIVGAVLAIIPCCGVILAWVLSGMSGVYIAAVFAHLFGQIGEEPPDQSLTIPGA